MADTVPTMLEPGEYVIKKSAAKKIGYKNLNKMNRGGKMPKVKYQGYKKGGKAKEAYSGTTRELALSVYRKEMAGKPLVGYEKEYSKSGSYKAFKKTKPYEESGRLIRGHALATPAMEKAKRMKAAGYKLPPGLRGGGKVKYEYYKKGGEVKKKKVSKKTFKTRLKEKIAGPEVGEWYREALPDYTMKKVIKGRVHGEKLKMYKKHYSKGKFRPIKRRRERAKEEGKWYLGKHTFDKPKKKKARYSSY